VSPRFTDEGTASMRAWKRTLLVALAAGVVVATPHLGIRSAFAADSSPPAATELAAASQGGDASENAAPVLPDTPDSIQTFAALGGGLLVLGLAAVGLTITFRSLTREIRGRRNRYRRRVRRVPRDARA
jgi:hypothetical protein